MRKEQLINENWLFRYHDGTETVLNIPHTWNAKDGQDGGNDYWRGTCIYEKDFTAPAYAVDERVYLQFNGVNASAKVILNGTTVMQHDGGYSTFRCDITEHLKAENHLVVEVDNSVNDRVYPQKADFTFYGGIYRDVKLITVNRHHFDPKRCLGYSEYSCECMPNLHTSCPHRGDQSEEYQCKYNEYMLKFFEKRPFMWATHLWNMFDFAADARNQGGEPGMNHKGLVTFDRKTRKDSFYIYKATWSREPFVYLCGRRYVDRPEKETNVKIYSNQKEVTLYANGEKVGTQRGDRIFNFRIPLSGEVKLEAVAGECRDEIFIRYVQTPNPDYKLGKDSGNGGNWT